MGTLARNGLRKPVYQIMFTRWCTKCCTLPFGMQKAEQKHQKAGSFPSVLITLQSRKKLSSHNMQYYFIEASKFTKVLMLKCRAIHNFYFYFPSASLVLGHEDLRKRPKSPEILPS